MDTQCINIIEIWCEPEPGEPCPDCEHMECKCEPGEGANFRDTEFCGRPGKPISTNDGIKYVCDRCRPYVVQDGMLNGWTILS